MKKYQKYVWMLVGAALFYVLATLYDDHVILHQVIEFLSQVGVASGHAGTSAAVLH